MHVKYGGTYSNHWNLKRLKNMTRYEAIFTRWHSVLRDRMPCSMGEICLLFLGICRLHFQDKISWAHWSLLQPQVHNWHFAVTSLTVEIFVHFSYTRNCVRKVDLYIWVARRGSGEIRKMSHELNVNYTNILWILKQCFLFSRKVFLILLENWYKDMLMFGSN
jgi:hypothetical protein